MMVWRAIPIFLSMLFAAPAAKADFDVTGLTDCGQVRAMEAIGGARFKTPAGETVKLALVKAPELWKKGDPYKSWPHAEASKDALWALLKDHDLQLYCEGQRTNHSGEIVAHIVMPDGTWLQHQLVSAGDVFVFPRPTRRRGLGDLYETENAARADRRGLWAFDNLQAIDALGDGVRTGWFQIIEGTVRSAQKVGTTIYLNFGDDWRTDFTIEIPGTAMRHFEKAGIDPLSLQDRFVEVRGWVDYKAGPRILLQGPGPLRDLAQKSRADPGSFK